MKLLTKIINLFKSHPIKAGATWYWADDIKNPFKCPREAVILDYKNKWVKYSTEGRTETIKESSFRYLYSPNK